MNSSSIRNLIIIVIIGGVIIAATYYILGKKKAPTALDQPTQGVTFQSWYQEKAKFIDDGKAASVLSEVEAKLDPSQFGTREAGMQFALYELRGDALLKLAKCGDAVESYETAAGNLNSAQFLFIRTDNKDPREQMMTDDERKAQMSRLQSKLAKAQACAQ